MAVALLSNIRSAHNVGSMFRTADAAGIDCLYLCGITPSPQDMLGSATKNLQKTALGAEKTVPWQKYARTADCIRRLKAQGYHICALELVEGATPYYDAPCIKTHTEKLAFIVGHEVDGLPATIIKKCDSVICIPMRGTKESLNVAVAFGVVAFEIAKYRLP